MCRKVELSPPWTAANFALIDEAMVRELLHSQNDRLLGLDGAPRGHGSQIFVSLTLYFGVSGLMELRSLESFAE